MYGCSRIRVLFQDYYYYCSPTILRVSIRRSRQHQGIVKGHDLLDETSSSELLRNGARPSTGLYDVDEQDKRSLGRACRQLVALSTAILAEIVGLFILRRRR